ncbi:MAG: GNAT family N-acetyltransferase, partial [Oscillospiraceae bacterium]
MQICNASVKDLPELKQMWQDIFKDGADFCDFAFTLCDLDGIFIIKDGEIPVAMLMAGINVTAYGKKGYYVYGVCTKNEYRRQGYAGALLEYVDKVKSSQGYDFAITCPATPELFSYYERFGFANKTYRRGFTVNIKRNLWASGDFDTVTFNKFKETREKFKEDEIVHFDPKAYEKFTEYVYKTGGSTVQTKDAYGVYFVEKNELFVKELFASCTATAQTLLQAIRERTGIETAHIQLSQNSSLFLGEGKLTEYALIKGMDREV